jgi:hypothetical protein
VRNPRVVRPERRLDHGERALGQLLRRGVPPGG